MLRPYQLNSVSQLREAYRKHLRVLLVMPTGSGKRLFSLKYVPQQLKEVNVHSFLQTEQRFFHRL